MQENWISWKKIILVKFILYVTEKCQKVKHFLAKPHQNGKYTPQKSNNFQPPPCPTSIGLLLRTYNNVQTEWQLCRP